MSIICFTYPPQKKTCPLQPKVKYESITRISAKKVIGQKMRNEFQIIK